MNIDQKMFRMMMLGQTLRKVSIEGNETTNNVSALISQRLANVPRHAKRYATNLYSEGEVLSEMPEITIVAGGTGAGKSLLVEALMSNLQYRNHQYYSFLEYIRPIVGDSENGFIPNENNLMVETILTSNDQRDYIVDLRNGGCKISMFFIGTDSPLVNINRIAKRVILKGKDCETGKIFSRYFKSLSGCLALMPFIHDLYIINNSSDSEPPQMVYRFQDGALVEEFMENAPTWARLFLSKT